MLKVYLERQDSQDERETRALREVQDPQGRLDLSLSLQAQRVGVVGQVPLACEALQERKE